MKAAHTTRLIGGEIVEQNWLLKDGRWCEVNRIPESLKDLGAIRFIPSGYERSSRLFDLCESARIWTIE